LISVFNSFGARFFSISLHVLSFRCSLLWMDISVFCDDLKYDTTSNYNS